MKLLQLTKSEFTHSPTMCNLNLNLNLLFYRITGLQLLYIDDDGVKIMLDKELLEGLRQQTTLESQHLSSPVTLLLTSLNRANPDFYTYRSVIKRFNLPENERFDIFTHADLNFVETMGNHLYVPQFFFKRFLIDIFGIQFKPESKPFKSSITTNT